MILKKQKHCLMKQDLIDVDGDGIREDADGNEFVLNFASMEGGEVAEPIATTISKTGQM